MGREKRGGGEVRRERSQPYSGNMFRNCFTSDGTREEKKEGREDKNVPPFLRARAVRRVASCPAEHHGVTFAGCDVENWIQVWDGVYRFRGKSRIEGER